MIWRHPFRRELKSIHSAPLKIGILYLCVHPNIGIARYPADGVSTEALLANAKFAMHLAKQHKTGFAFVHER
jgi:predicted signal transduction protein with EAL and GGDEF domain